MIILSLLLGQMTVIFASGFVLWQSYQRDPDAIKLGLKAQLIDLAGYFGPSRRDNAQNNYLDNNDQYEKSGSDGFKAKNYNGYAQDFDGDDEDLNFLHRRDTKYSDAYENHPSSTTGDKVSVDDILFHGQTQRKAKLAPNERNLASSTPRPPAVFELPSNLAQIHNPGFVPSSTEVSQTPNVATAIGSAKDTHASNDILAADCAKCFEPRQADKLPPESPDVSKPDKIKYLRTRDAVISPNPVFAEIKDNVISGPESQNFFSFSLIDKPALVLNVSVDHRSKLNQINLTVISYPHEANISEEEMTYLTALVYSLFKLTKFVPDKVK